MSHGSTTTDIDDPQVVKACCAAAYGHDLAAYLLGDSYHPGGAALTRRLADTMGLSAGDRVVDVAAGTGTTALLLAAERNVDVEGIDLGSAQVELARQRATAAGLTERVRFRLGDAERLPLGDASVDAVVCECAFCTFPDKPSAAAELARVLRPGGTLGITDVWLDPELLDADLRGLAARVACIADARPIVDICGYLEAVGLIIDTVERHDHTMIDLIDRISSRLRLARMMAPEALEGVDVSRAIDIAAKASDTVHRGDAGYVLITARRPESRPAR